MSNKIWVLTYTIGTNEGRKSRRLICDTKERAIRQQTVLGGDLVEYLRKPEAVAEKLERNKRRAWGEVKDGEPCHHVKN